MKFLIVVLLSTLFNTNIQAQQRILHDYNKVPLYNPDYELLERVLTQKQRLLNSRRNFLQDKYNGFMGILSAAKTANNGFTDSQTKYVYSVFRGVDIIAQYDLSIEQNWTNAINWYASVEVEISSW